MIDVMAALKRSLAQEMPLTAMTAKEKRPRLAAHRHQLLPVAGGRIGKIAALQRELEEKPRHSHCG